MLWPRLNLAHNWFYSNIERTVYGLGAKLEHIGVFCTCWFILLKPILALPYNPNQGTQNAQTSASSLDLQATPTPVKVQPQDRQVGVQKGIQKSVQEEDHGADDKGGHEEDCECNFVPCTHMSRPMLITIQLCHARWRAAGKPSKNPGCLLDT